MSNSRKKQGKLGPLVKFQTRILIGTKRTNTQPTCLRTVSQSGAEF